MKRDSRRHDNARIRGAKAARILLTWYHANARILPWRARPGNGADSYRVWLSEIMLQQTTVSAVVPYYRKFLDRWPNVQALARAELDEVLGAWAGLGYYSRARNLHRTARIIAQDFSGVIPNTAAELKKLPGIGAYTSAAIAAIAFGEMVPALDANGERVIARLFGITRPLPKSRPELLGLAKNMLSGHHPGDFAQALMDLGSGVCKAKKPECPNCPISAQCVAFARGSANRLPRKEAKAPRPVKRGTAFVAFDRKGAVYLEKRPENGLLGAMLQPPMSKWHIDFPRSVRAPFAGKWRTVPGVVQHGFTHLQLEMRVYAACFERRPPGKGRWYASEELPALPLPTVMRKIIAHAKNGQISSARMR